MLFNLLFLLLLHIVSEKWLHWYYKEDYKNILPVLKHSFIYSLIFIIPSFFIFDISSFGYFVATLFFLHYSINYFMFNLYYYINEKNRSLVLDLDNFIHIVCLFYCYEFFI